MIFKVRPLIIEQVRLENGKIDKNGALYEVIWFNTGDYEIHALQPVNTISQVGRIPFNPNYPRIRNGEDVEADNRWGDRMSYIRTKNMIYKVECETFDKKGYYIGDYGVIFKEQVIKQADTIE